MTRLEALKELVERGGHEAGFRSANRAVFGTPCQDIDLQLREEHSRQAYGGSLDAAKALHDAVLPSYKARIDVGRRYRAWVISPTLKKVDAYALNPARAWLIAILKALIAEERDK